MRFLRTTAIAGTMALASGGAYAASVTVSTDATALANALLGSGITVVSASLTGGNGSGSAGATAAGTFTGFGATGIGIDQGVILSTGDVQDAVGPNSSDGTSTSFGLGGDSDLNALIPGFSTFDATVLTINFTSDDDTLFFNYAFASEEYNEYVGSPYNDVFGLFLNGTNLAFIPGTSTPVSINNVNNGSNSAFYKDNDPSDLGTPTPFNIEYDGFTSVFTAQGAIAEGMNTISFKIADAGDRILDSAIFIQGGSLGTTDPGVIPLPAGAWLMLTGLGALGVMRRRRNRA
ncbi:VPLPA-CTERM sorting domain-containing protein [Rhodovulum tesquicola]|uniref:choice-of-anchor L domain-containing protein n=1 Tax=Rhodovulum tesquicola TaxID=540254 RepID=UPI002096F291|nr:choice-of-anchor L domain-containing protein [Rhodovulum tesquicola]MCO8145563.1 VPLPA-CTERM sorting domain-containing protein [Rhodovulum tesquicola]